MKRNIVGLGLVAMIALMWSSCVKAPEYPIAPVATFVKFSKDTVRQGLDTCVITIAFTDGDGDLGALDTDTVQNLFLTNTNLGHTFTYRIPHIPEQGIGNGISGEIELTLLPSDNCCLDTDLICTPQLGAADELVIYEVEIEDRSGKRSAPIELPPLRLVCDY